MCEEQGSGLDRVPEAERLLFVVQAQVVDALHQLRDLHVVRRPLYHLRVVTLFKLQTCSQNHLWDEKKHYQYSLDLKNGLLLVLSGLYTLVVCL